MMEDHEPATVAAACEFAEETGAAVDPTHLQLVHLMHHVSIYGGARRIAFFFSTDRWTGSIGNPEPESAQDGCGTKAAASPLPCRPTLPSPFSTSPTAPLTASSPGPPPLRIVRGPSRDGRFGQRRRRRSSRRLPSVCAATSSRAARPSAW
ncbi:hypothetical protein ACIRSJ_12225 [Streptomyces virginiae]|uniref:hypothetical protein n=1 Tax=Streptomyces virginiae TaxID=1961 RepID=UPI00380149CE